jgi:hypothetical protein
MTFLQNPGSCAVSMPFTAGREMYFSAYYADRPDSGIGRSSSGLGRLASPEVVSTLRREASTNRTLPGVQEQPRANRTLSPPGSARRGIRRITIRSDGSCGERRGRVQQRQAGDYPVTECSSATAFYARPANSPATDTSCSTRVV